MTRRRLCAGAIAASLAIWLSAGARAVQPPAAAYFPPPGEWRTLAPEAAGLDAARLDEAVAFALEHENPETRDLAELTPRQFRNEAPYNTLIGRAAPRGGATGLIVRRGAVVAEWGDTRRADMAFSVTKTFLSTVVGVAFDRGSIRDVTDRVAAYMPKDVDLFSSPHNAPITWEHLLRQTSDWSGTLWGKPDWADRPPAGQTPEQWAKRELRTPGTVYEYNDTRINVLALAALHVFRRPLPEVLAESVMEPIGASDSWRWEGYENSWVTIGGRRVQSVSGGGHFGGGMFISAEDMARFGYLFLRDGRWGGRQIISRKWIAMARSPGPANQAYGFCNWFLNNPVPPAGGGAPRLPFPSAPRSSVTFQGNGVNVIYIDPENDLLMVARWVDGNANLDRLIGKVLGAIRRE